MRQGFLATLVAVASVVAPASLGCHVNRDFMLSGGYLCSSDADCGGNGWECRSSADNQKVCVAPGDEVRTPAADGPPTEDSGPSAGLDTRTPAPDELGPAADALAQPCEPGATLCPDTIHLQTCAPDGRSYLTEECGLAALCKVAVGSTPQAARCVESTSITGLVEMKATVKYDASTEREVYEGGVDAVFKFDATPYPYPLPPDPGTCVTPGFGSDPPILGEPFDGGRVDVLLPGQDTLLTYDPELGAYAPDQAVDVASFPFGLDLFVSIFGNSTIGQGIDLYLTFPPLRLITAPAHDASVDTTLPLEVTWSGTRAEGQVALSLMQQVSGRDKALAICSVSDSGAFTIPASLVSRLDPGQPTWVRLSELRFDESNFDNALAQFRGQIEVAHERIVRPRAP